MAKHLAGPLNQAGDHFRPAFLTVTRLDGRFGLGEGSDFAPITGGLFGLVKTLNLEWERVFCRAIDLSPDLNPAESAFLVIAEMHDPNRLVMEPGYNLQGRATLTLTQEEPVLLQA
jgi:hypothetical protein